MVKFTKDDMTASGIIPEGVHTFQVKELKPAKSKGQVTAVVLKAAISDGRTIRNPYNLKYDGARKALLKLLTVGCGLEPDADGNIDEADAVGKFFKATVVHNEGTTGRMFDNLGYIEGSAQGFDDGSDETDDVVIEEDIIEEETDDDGIDGWDD